METGFTWPTIWDLCNANGVPWGYYFVDLPAVGLWGRKNANGAHHLESLFADLAAGTLPNVTFVDPGFTSGLRTDEHPTGDVRAGQAFVHNVVKSVLESPLWPRTALFINYDEWGGFFDHVAPPRVADVRGTPADPAGQNDFGQLGFRVPCTVVSPYARRGALASQVIDNSGVFFEHCSILRYIESLFLRGRYRPRATAMRATSARTCSTSPSRRASMRPRSSTRCRARCSRAVRATARYSRARLSATRSRTAPGTDSRSSPR
jgi:phospholipase C